MTANKKTTSGFAALAAVILLQSAAFAQESAPVAVPPSPQTTASIAETPNGGTVPIYSGGVAEELDYIKSIQHQYDLKLLITEVGGAFLADLPVTIRNKSGDTVVSTVTKGPILLVTLPAGSYDVAVTDNGQTKKQKVTVDPKSLKTYQFLFPAAPGDIQ